MKIHIKGGRLIDPRSGVDAKKDVYITAGRIVAIGDAPNGYTANRVIDAAGLVVCPGLVDLAARLREPGFEYMATLESEMEAAIAGGVTRPRSPRSSPSSGGASPWGGSICTASTRTICSRTRPWPS